MASNPFIIVELEATAPEIACDGDHLANVHQLLQEFGLLTVRLKFQDPKSAYLRDLIIGLHERYNHGLPVAHSEMRGWFWDVKPSIAEKSFLTQLARSETFEPFPWHTDCSYESAVPRYVALQVLEHDKHGGGTLSMLPVQQLLERLTARTIESLGLPEYRITVPPEFAKINATEIIGPVLSLSQGTSEEVTDPFPAVTGGKYKARESRQHIRMRFRADIIQPLTPEGSNALLEVQSCLSDRAKLNELGVLHLTSDDLPRDSIILMDNGRWLHSRSEVKDPTRHLRRVRWDSRP